MGECAQVGPVRTDRTHRKSAWSSVYIAEPGMVYGGGQVSSPEFAVTEFAVTAIEYLQLPLNH